jgi:Rhodopirellula transposase DDE domain
VDDEVDGEAGRHSHRAGSPGGAQDGGQAVEGPRLQPAGQRQEARGAQHPDRDAQFDYLNAQVSAFLDAGEPVISVDSKKKQNVGTYSNGGAQYAPKGEPEATNTYDFIGEGGKVAPYGVYDVAANTGWVNVGTDADTDAFAVESIRRWWTKVGALAYPRPRSC